jgi:hypothetical protein
MLTFLTFIRKVLIYRSLDQAAIQALMFQAQLSANNSTLFLEVNPLDHYFGKIESKAVIKMHGLSSRPDVTFSVKLYQVDNIIKKLYHSRLLSHPELRKLSQLIHKYTVKQENGDAVMLMEFDPKMPGKIKLNGVIKDRKNKKAPMFKMF